MAKRLTMAAADAPTEGSTEREVRSNPDFFGIDVERVLAGAIGLAGTAALNDSIVSPIVSRVLPLEGVAAGLVNAGTTFATALALDKALSMVGMRGAGRDAALGGEFLGAARVVGSFAPNLMVISASIPALSGLGGKVTSITDAKKAKGNGSAGQLSAGASYQDVPGPGISESLSVAI